MNTYIQNSTFKTDSNFTYETTEILVTQYAKANNAVVQKTVSITDVLETIKNGDEHFSLIQKARQIGKGSSIYDHIKINQLPTFRFNFLFNDSASNKNLTVPTGLIYIDYDNVEEIPENEYIFAKWKSLSNTGYGVLVKIDNLSLSNFKDAYNAISNLILPNTDSDKGARKATQQTVQSFDCELYLNTNSITYHYAESKKVYLVNTIEKKKEGITSNNTFSKNSNYDPIRYNNISDYFTGEHSSTPYIVFSEEKTKICQPFIPNKIKEGSRNSTMFSVLSNFSLLNFDCGKGLLKMFSHHLNSRMYPKLSDYEVNSIIDKVLQKRENGELEIYLNKERRLLFNPAIPLTRQEKYQITGAANGAVRKTKTKQKIYQSLENWNFEKDGKITQKKVATNTTISVPTIKKYWAEFKNYVQDLNLQ